MSLVCAEQRAVVGCVGWLRGRAVTAHATRRGRLSYELSCIAVCVRRCDCDMCALACRTIGMRRDTEEIPRRGGGDGRRGASMGASRLAIAISSRGPHTRRGRDHRMRVSPRDCRCVGRSRIDAPKYEVDR